MAEPDARPEAPATRRQVFSWALWDWATQPFNSVILTFVFASLYTEYLWFDQLDFASVLTTQWIATATIRGSRRTTGPTMRSGPGAATRGSRA